MGQGERPLSSYVGGSAANKDRDAVLGWGLWDLVLDWFRRVARYSQNKQYDRLFFGQVLWDWFPVVNRLFVWVSGIGD